MPAVSTILGPGTLTIGTTPGKDVSTQVRSCALEVDKEQEDALPVLSGDQVAGSVAYTYTLKGSILQDLAVVDGVVQYSWDNAGMELDFVFTPNSSALASFTGRLIVDPLNVGGDEMSAVLESKFEWVCVGAPVPTWPVATP